MKATRGCIPPMKETEKQLEDEQQKENQCNSEKYRNQSIPMQLDVHDGAKVHFRRDCACVFAIPIMTVHDAENWGGGQFSVIILCDKESNGKASARQIAQRLGLTNTKFDLASTSEQTRRKICWRVS